MTVAESFKADTPPSHNFTKTGEPHHQRRKLILAKHGPEIRALMGNNPWTAVPILLATVLQIAVAYTVKDMPWMHVAIAAYAISAVLNGNLMAGHHELSHFLVFKSPFANRVVMAISNMPLCAPLGSLFRQYHMEHHSHMGVDGIDTGIWLNMEAKMVTHSMLSRWAFMIIFPIFFFFRPFFMMIAKPADWTDVVAWILVPAFDIAVFYYWGAKALVYMVAGTFIGVGLHPIAGHVISEHVQMADGQETFSCYDNLLNPLLYNFGYHVEHHDFPSIPWNRLPKIRKIAPEFYEPLRSYNSWTMVMWEFLTRRDVAQTGIMTKRPSRTGDMNDTMIPESMLVAAGKKA